MATLDLVVLRHRPGFVQQADLYIATLEVNVRFCRRSSEASASLRQLHCIRKRGSSCRSWRAAIGRTQVAAGERVPYTAWLAVASLGGWPG
jgi:hypothetical protein